MKVADFITGGDDDHEGELWVVALGTNDVNQYGEPDELAVAVDEMLDAVPDDVPLVWVDTYYRDQLEGAAMVNTVVADRLARRGNAVMARWSDAAGRRRRGQQGRRASRPTTASSCSPTSSCQKSTNSSAADPRQPSFASGFLRTGPQKSRRKR